MRRFDTNNVDSELERIRIAYHEAGHAVATWAYGIPLKLIVAGEIDGYAERGLDNDSLRQRLGEIEFNRTVAVILLSGQAAQNRWQWETLAFGCDEDRRHARKHAEECPGSVEEMVVSALLRDWAAEAMRMIEDNWPRVQALAQNLLEQGTISGPDATRIIDGAA